MAQATRLALGEKGPEVRSVQERLTALGYDPGLVDGVFGRVTEEAVKRFQRRIRVEPDGVLVADTLARLLADDAPAAESRQQPAAQDFRRAATDDTRDGEAARPEPKAVARPSLRMLADQPLQTDAADRLAFADYADALAGLIDNPSTTTPLTLAINGPWGAGKSTLAAMVQRRLESKPAAGGTRPHVTCAFNAWMHDDAPNLGSALAAGIARAAAIRRPLLRRLLRPLPWGLISPEDRRVQAVLIVVGGLALSFAAMAALAWRSPGTLHEVYGMLQFLIGDEGKEVRTLGTLGAFASLLLTAGKWVFSLGKSLSSFVKNPESAASSLSLQMVRDQLGALIAQATPPGSRFVIFIDDLERCRPPRSVEILETVNQLLSHPGVVTVIMADMPAVAACADIKYRDLAERYTPGGRTAAPTPTGRSAYGRLYLQKIVQLQFDMPPAQSERLRRLVQLLVTDAQARAERERPSKAYLVGRRLGQWLYGTRAVLFSEGARGARRIVQHILLRAAAAAGLLLVIAAAVAYGLDRTAAAAALTVALLALVGEGAWRIVRVVQQRRSELLNEARARIDAALRQAGADLAPLSRSLAYWGAVDNLIRERQLLQLMNDSDLLEEAYDEVFHHLPQLPRNAKRMINRLRVLLFVAHARGLFAGDRAITPRHIGKWVALQEQWPELAQAVLLEPGCVARLEQAAEDAARFVTLAAELLPGAPADEKLRAFCGSREVCLAAAAERITYLT